MAVESGGGGDLHLQLLALGGVGRHGVAVVRPEAALALGPHRLGQFIGGVRAGAPASQSAALFGWCKDTRVNPRSRANVATATRRGRTQLSEETVVERRRRMPG